MILFENLFFQLMRLVCSKKKKKKDELFYCKCHDHFDMFEHILQHLRHQQYIQLC